jgi:hypothetical protein
LVLFPPILFHRRRGVVFGVDRIARLLAYISDSGLTLRRLLYFDFCTCIITHTCIARYIPSLGYASPALWYLCAVAACIVGLSFAESLCDVLCWRGHACCVGWLEEGEEVGKLVGYIEVRVGKGEYLD